MRPRSGQYCQSRPKAADTSRIVARIGIATFLERFPPGSVRLAEDYEFENVPTFFEIGPRRLPVDTRVT